AAFAVLKAGGVLNPVNPALGEAELRYILQHAGPRVVVTDAASEDRIRGLGVTTVRGSTLTAAGPESPPDVGLGPDDASTLLYTSGTTGAPKGVLFTHGRSGTSGPHFIAALGLVPDDVLLAVTPLFHGNAWGAVVTALHAGATAAFPAAFHASAFWPLAHETGATVLFTLGTVLAMLLTREPSPLERTSRQRVHPGARARALRGRGRARVLRLDRCGRGDDRAARRAAAARVVRTTSPRRAGEDTRRRRRLAARRCGGRDRRGVARPHGCVLPRSGGHGMCAPRRLVPLR